jgi:hypothetical protein
MSTESTGTVVRIVIPLMKAISDVDTGEIRHAGIASDESQDIDGEVVPFDMLAKSFGYLSSHGKHNFNHRPDLIGEVMSVGHIGPEAARAKFGVDITGNGTAIEGTVYRLLGKGLDPPDVMSAHHRMRAGARMGYSLDGLCARQKGGGFSSVFVPRIAICDQPINATTVCRMVKSLTGAMEAIGLDDADLPAILQDLEQAPDVVLNYTGPGRQESDYVTITKGLLAALTRSIWGPKESPPLGGFWEALGRLQKA